jgi:arylsulfatase A-like enzyme
VELLDLFPTLLELTGLPARGDLEGHSIVPQLQDATAPREWPAITTQNHDNHAIRTERWRYIHYADGTEELYDLEADPHEWKNLAGDASLLQVKAGLARWLPKINKQPVPGSAQRVLTYDPASGEVNWEGRKVGADEPIPD